MLLKFLSSTALFNAEMGGGADVPVQADTGMPMDQVTQENAHREPELPQAELPQDKPADTPKPTLEEDLDKIWDESQKPADERDDGRDAQGRFKSKEQSQDGDEPPGDNDQPAENGEQSDPNEVTDDMPHSWSKDKADVWKALPPEARAIVAERETAMTQALSRAGRAVNTLKNVAPVLEAVEPFREYLTEVGRHVGKPPAQLIHDVLRFENTLRTAPDNDTKLGVIADIIAEYGVDLTPVFGRDGHEAVVGRQPATDPRVEQLARQVHELTAAQRAQAQEAQAALDADLGTAIQSVESNTREFPHYATVKRAMAAIIPQIEDTGQPTIELLKEAYRIACHVHPDVSKRIQQDQQRRTEQDVRQTIQTRTQRSQKAASANVRSGVPSIPKRSRDEDLEAVASKHYR